MILKNLLSLPIEQKIGQLFFIGLSGTQIDAATRRLLTEVSPGGICLFARNIAEPNKSETARFDLRAQLPVEPFFSVDQEGGLVDRCAK
jgi:beta-N-acetylhexosaminidase